MDKKWHGCEISPKSHFETWVFSRQIIMLMKIHRIFKRIWKKKETFMFF